MSPPTSAIIAITLNCNSRCVMCDIWKNKIKHELEPKYYLKLPSTLKDINITGGEPFLRTDIVEIVKNIKIAAPKARLVLNTNGFMPHKIKRDMTKIIKIDPTFAFRVSIDGIGKKHDEIRRIPGGFNKILQTLEEVKTIGVKDLGISFTLIKENIHELPKVQQFAQDNNYEFSLTVATSSSIYFGANKHMMRPQDLKTLEPLLRSSANIHFQHINPKEILRGWFVSSILDYIKTGKRAIKCDAGSNFFYLDSKGNVYTCHLKPWKIGNITKKPIEQILQNNRYIHKVALCNDCWMICTAKTGIRNNLLTIGSTALSQAVSQSIRKHN